MARFCQCRRDPAAGRRKAWAVHWPTGTRCAAAMSVRTSVWPGQDCAPPPMRSEVLVGAHAQIAAGAIDQDVECVFGRDARREKTLHRSACAPRCGPGADDILAGLLHRIGPQREAGPAAPGVSRWWSWQSPPVHATHQRFDNRDDDEVLQRLAVADVEHSRGSLDPRRARGRGMRASDSAIGSSLAVQPGFMALAVRAMARPKALTFLLSAWASLGGRLKIGWISWLAQALTGFRSYPSEGAGDGRGWP